MDEVNHIFSRTADFQGDDSAYIKAVCNAANGLIRTKGNVSPEMKSAFNEQGLREVDVTVAYKIVHTKTLDSPDSDRQKKLQAQRDLLDPEQNDYNHYPHNRGIIYSTLDLDC